MTGSLRLDDCALCDPEARAADEHRFPVARLATATLYLKRDQRFRGACVLVYARRHARGLDHLTADEAAEHARDLHAASRAVAAAAGAEHMNHLSLGNVVPHLHWHLLPRRRDDGAWGRPHWEAAGPEVHRPDAECRALVEAIRAALDQPKKTSASL